MRRRKYDRVQVAYDILSRLSNTPINAFDLGFSLGVKPDVIYLIVDALRTVGLVKVIRGYGGGVVATGAAWEKEDLEELLEQPTELMLAIGEQKRECSICHETKTYIFSGNVNTQNKRLYHDAEGNEWKGKRCSNCTTKRVIEPKALSKRKCRRCLGPLPITRYFDCETCRPVLGSVNDAFIYHSNLSYTGAELDKDVGDVLDPNPNPRRTCK